MKRASAILVALALLLVVSGTAMGGGRPDKSWKTWFTNLAIGGSFPQGDFDDLAKDGWYIKGGAMMWPEDWPVGLEFTAAYTASDLTSEVIEAFNDSQPPGSGTVDGGDVDTWSIESNVVWGPKTGGTVGFYLTGGVGVDFIEAKLKTTGLVYYPPVCWYWCYPGGIGTGTLIAESESTTEFSYNAGIGIDFELNSGTKLYLEATYHSAQTDGFTTDYVPLIFGVRF